MTFVFRIKPHQKSALIAFLNLSGSISRLGLQTGQTSSDNGRGILTASGSFDNTTFEPDMGRLHSMGNSKVGRYLQYSGWLSKPLNNGKYYTIKTWKSFMYSFFQIYVVNFCFVYLAPFGTLPFR